MSCFHPRSLTVLSRHPSRAFPQKFIALEGVPCGKCVACLRRRQNEYATRLYRECEKSETMFFVTLTYSNDNLPIARSYYTYDEETGERVRINTPPEIVTDPDELRFARGEILKQKSSSKPRYFVCDPPSEVKALYDDINLPPVEVSYTPSLNREHVRVWLKKFRIQFKRDFGRLPSFRYAFCGEYGPRGCRPHYHIIFLGLSGHDLLILLARWNFGFTNFKFVPIINKDGSDARQICSKYVGKYVSKGKFDCESVKCGDAIKGRLCNSKRFGTKDFTPEEIAYYRCYDVLGCEYDPDLLVKYPEGLSKYRPIAGDWLWDRRKSPIPVPLSRDEIDKLVPEIVKRNAYKIVYNKTGKEIKIPLPRALKKYLWYVKYSFEDPFNKKVESSWRSCTLFRFVVDYIQNMVFERTEQRYRSYLLESGSEDSSEARAVFSLLDDPSESFATEVIEEADFSFLLNRPSKDNQ